MHILASQSNLFYFILFFNEVYTVPFKGQLGCRQSTPETDNWSSAILLDIASKQSAYQTVSWRSLLHPETRSPLSLSESWLSSRNTAYMAHGVQRGFSTRPRGTPTHVIWTEPVKILNSILLLILCSLSNTITNGVGWTLYQWRRDSRKTKSSLRINVLLDSGGGVS